MVNEENNNTWKTDLDRLKIIPKFIFNISTHEAL
jgi:hypothetical protein